MQKPAGANAADVPEGASVVLVTAAVAGRDHSGRTPRHLQPAAPAFRAFLPPNFRSFSFHVPRACQWHHLLCRDMK